MAKRAFKESEVRNKYLKMVTDFLLSQGEDIQIVGTTSIAFPVVDDAGEEGALKFTVSSPHGSREGEPYNVYEEAENFKFEQEEKAEKKRKEAEKREKKKAADAAAREEKKRIREQKRAEREAAKAAEEAEEDTED